MTGAPTCWKECATCSEPVVDDRREQLRKERVASEEGTHDLGWQGRLGSGWTAEGRSSGDRSCCRDLIPAEAFHHTWPVMGFVLGMIRYWY
jgi:hypothetical protein